MDHIENNIQYTNNIQHTFENNQQENKKRKIENVSSFETIPFEPNFLLFFQGQNILNFRDIHLSSEYNDCTTNDEKREVLKYALHIGRAFHQFNLIDLTFYKDKKNIQIKWNENSNIYEDFYFAKDTIEDNIMFLIEHGHPDFKTPYGETIF